ncbi:leucine-rich repeat and fibronectin type-III domain-containing protein 5-like [Parasteatoda tepidariorum]|uniref:leucine-rich repeat and fibronectin type-III domain-containing protein 5-like n=1 Tax=Parasteatoda tepidariorum TaxID=114398 RepID=UPI0039BCBD7F
MTVFNSVILILCFSVQCIQMKQAASFCARTINTIYGYEIECSGIDNPDNLRKAFYKSNEGNSLTGSETVTISDSDFSYIPHDLFQDFKIDTIIIKSTTLSSLSDTDTAFDGLEKDLRVIEIRDSFLFKDLDWCQLRNLKRVFHIQLNNIGLEYIDSDVSCASYVEFLYLGSNRISYISDQAFASFAQLWKVDLQENKISEMKRGMLPNPAKKLYMINLSSNQISSLPKDFFTNMPKLEKINLSENNFHILDETLYAPVWKEVISLSLSGNPLRCDCRMKWLLNLKFPFSTTGTCVEPIELNGRDIISLNRLELWCF